MTGAEFYATEHLNLLHAATQNQAQQFEDDE